MVIEQKTGTLALRELITRFLGRRNLSPRTVDYYSNILSHLQWYARQSGWPEQAGNITRGHIRDFLDYVATERHRWPEGRRPSCEKASPATVHHYGKVVKALFNWAEEEECLDADPSSRLKLGAPQYKEVEPYTDEEVRTFLEVCEQDAKTGYRYLGIRNKAIISLFIAPGLRLEELSGINLSDFDARLQQVQTMGKGGKARVVPINGEAKNL